MHRRNSQVTSPPTDRTQPLGQVAVVAAVGTVLGTRSRMAGALFLAGMAWLALRHRKSPSVSAPSPSTEAMPEPSPIPRPQAAKAVSLDEICAPSDPFLDYPVDEEEWQDLRAALRPPPSLFTPPDPAGAVAVMRPGSSLLQSAPVYIEVEESFPTDTRDTEAHAILPDTITIPATPDPPPELMAEMPALDLGKPQAHPPLQPKAGMPATAASQPDQPSDMNEPSSPPPVARKKRGFLDWLREG